MAQSSHFHHHGHFTEAGQPFSGEAEFQFEWWDAAANGIRVARTDLGTLLENERVHLKC